ncbi:hypothetical protein ACFXPS_42000 [Nocardia sp. NPDC059091]|uniref:hypothetical protein n=1 Tax=Nocardia sp. NPDC059091 TaxID=3346724 RepID=UPI00367EE024
MKHTRIAASFAAGTAIVALSCGTAHAAPAQPDSIDIDIAPGVHYTGSSDDNSVVVNTPFGSLITKGSQFQVLDNRGGLVAGEPLTSTIETTPRAQPDLASTTEPAPNAVIPVDADAPQPRVRPVDATADFNGALALAATQFGLATGVGTVAGGVIGLGIGCGLGALTGGFTALPTGPIAVPAALLGCVIGASVGGGIGAVAGGALLGVPVGIASAVQMYNSLTTPAPSGADTGAGAA